MPVARRTCPGCRQPLWLDSRGKVAVWRLGDIEDGVLGPVVAGIRRAYGRAVVVQPAYLDERPSARERAGWRGLSAKVFLEQVRRRHRRDTYLSLGITAKNMVYDRGYNYLFGLAYEGLRAATMSLHPLGWNGRPPKRLVADRAVKVAVHELGHGLGLDHHPYDAGVHCVMIGDVERDTLPELDASTARFCRACRRLVTSRARRPSTRTPSARSRAPR